MRGSRDWDAFQIGIGDEDGDATLGAAAREKRPRLREGRVEARAARGAVGRSVALVLIRRSRAGRRVSATVSRVWPRSPGAA